MALNIVLFKLNQNLTLFDGVALIDFNDFDYSIASRSQGIFHFHSHRQHQHNIASLDDIDTRI
jgi:hypothetical protein